MDAHTVIFKSKVEGYMKDVSYMSKKAKDKCDALISKLEKSKTIVEMTQIIANFLILLKNINANVLVISDHCNNSIEMFKIQYPDEDVFLEVDPLKLLTKSCKDSFTQYEKSDFIDAANKAVKGSAVECENECSEQSFGETDEDQPAKKRTCLSLLRSCTEETNDDWVDHCSRFNKERTEVKHGIQTSDGALNHILETIGVSIQNSTKNHASTQNSTGNRMLGRMLLFKDSSDEEKKDELKVLDKNDLELKNESTSAKNEDGTNIEHSPEIKNGVDNSSPSCLQNSDNVLPSTKSVDLVIDEENQVYTEIPDSPVIDLDSDNEEVQITSEVEQPVGDLDPNVISIDDENDDIIDLSKDDTAPKIRKRRKRKRVLPRSKIISIDDDQNECIDLSEDVVESTSENKTEDDKAKENSPDDIQLDNNCLNVQKWFVFASELYKTYKTLQRMATLFTLATELYKKYVSEQSEKNECEKPNCDLDPVCTVLDSQETVILDGIMNDSEGIVSETIQGETPDVDKGATEAVLKESAESTGENVPTTKEPSTSKEIRSPETESGELINTNMIGTKEIPALDSQSVADRPSEDASEKTNELSAPTEPLEIGLDQESFNPTQQSLGISQVDTEKLILTEPVENCVDQESFNPTQQSLGVSEVDTEKLILPGSSELMGGSNVEETVESASIPHEANESTLAEKGSDDELHMSDLCSERSGSDRLSDSGTPPGTPADNNEPEGTRSRSSSCCTQPLPDLSIYLTNELPESMNADKETGNKSNMDDDGDTDSIPDDLRSENESQPPLEKDKGESEKDKETFLNYIGLESASEVGRRKKGETNRDTYHSDSSSECSDLLTVTKEVEVRNPDTIPRSRGPRKVKENVRRKSKDANDIFNKLMEIGESDISDSGSNSCDSRVLEESSENEDEIDPALRSDPKKFAQENHEKEATDQNTEQNKTVIEENHSDEDTEIYTLSDCIEEKKGDVENSSEIIKLRNTNDDLLSLLTEKIGEDKDQPGKRQTVGSNKHENKVLKIVLVDCVKYPRLSGRTGDSIDRLCDISSLEHTKRRRSSTTHGGKKHVKKLKRTKSGSNTDSTESCSDITDSDMTYVSSPTTPVNSESLVDPKELLAEILCGNIKDISGNESTDDDSDRSNNNIKSKQDRKRDKRLKLLRKLSEEERQKKKWRSDPLLRGKLSSSDSSDNDDEDKPNKRGRGLKTKYEEDDDFVLHTHISIKSDDSSDSAVITINSKSPKNSTSSRRRVVSIKSTSSSSSSDDDSVIDVVNATPISNVKGIDSGTEEDVQFVGTESSGKKGRRNIRALVADEDLAEATQIARLEEEERIQRIQEQEKTIDSFQSQSSDLQPGESIVLDVDETTNEPLITVDARLSKRLKPHQEEGIRFMWQSCYESVKRLKNHPGSGCILAHCMGLGKTYQVIALIHTLFKHKVTNTNHVLIVCPLSTVGNWKSEFRLAFNLLKKDDVNLRVATIANRKDNVRKLDIVNKWHDMKGVLILGYEAFESMTKDSMLESLSLTKRNKIYEALVEPGPDLIVCDEGHLLRNKKALKTVALMKVATHRRIVLTGTPLQNNLPEYYYMVRFVKPNLLGTMKEYKNNFVNPITNGQYDDSTAEDIMLMKKRTHVLHKILKRTIQRREVSELEIYLPKIHDYALFIQLSPLQHSLYKTYLETAVKSEQLKKRFFSDYRTIKNICSHPYILSIVDNLRKQLNKKKLKEEEVIINECEIDETPSGIDGWWIPSCPSDVTDNLEYGTKFQVMRSIIEEAEAQNEKVLIFSNSLAEMDCIEHFLQLKGTSRCPSWKSKVDYYRMDGTVHPELRTEMTDDFNNRSNTQLRLFIMSHKVGGLGLNLTAANRVILMGVNFNPSYDTQSVYRAYRFGQEKVVYVYRLITMGTMEEKNYQRCVTKLAIASRVVDKHQITRHYKSVELQEMYQFEVDLDQERQTPNVPDDKLLAKLLMKHPSIFKYHVHQALLENRPDEDLDEQEKNKAWEEFNKQNEPPPPPPPLLPMPPILLDGTQNQANMPVTQVTQPSRPIIKTGNAPRVPKNRKFNQQELYTTLAKRLYTTTSTGSTDSANEFRAGPSLMSYPAVNISLETDPKTGILHLSKPAQSDHVSVSSSGCTDQPATTVKRGQVTRKNYANQNSSSVVNSCYGRSGGQSPGQASNRLAQRNENGVVVTHTMIPNSTTCTLESANRNRTGTSANQANPSEPSSAEPARTVIPDSSSASTQELSVPGTPKLVRSIRERLKDNPGNSTFTINNVDVVIESDDDVVIEEEGTTNQDYEKLITPNLIRSDSKNIPAGQKGKVTSQRVPPWVQSSNSDVITLD